MTMSNFHLFFYNNYSSILTILCVLFIQKKYSKYTILYISTALYIIYLNLFLRLRNRIFIKINGSTLLVCIFELL